MRTVLKTASYGCVHVCVAVAVAYALTGDLTVAVGIGLVEPLVQTGVFAVHERLWEGRGSRARFELNGVVATFHRPRPQKEAKPHQVRDAREFLTRAGVKP